MTDNIFHLKAWFSGHVQGVGFRYTVCQIAQEFPVCGTIANLEDGRVALQAEGPKKEVLAFQKAIEKRMKSFIYNVVTETSIQAPHFQGFKIL